MHLTDGYISCSGTSIMQLVQYYSVYLCTSASPPVSIEAEATIAFTPVATNGVHTAMVAVVGALAFIDICM